MSNPAPEKNIRRRAPIALKDCPMAKATDILADKWTLLILREALYGVQRYDDMRADLQAPRSMLTDRLSKLVDHGLMERQSYQEPGSRARQAYVLTSMGRELALTLLALSQWGEAHVIDGNAPYDVKDTKTGGNLRVALVDEKGKAVDLTRAQIVPKRK
mgnify:FL=1